MFESIIASILSSYLGDYIEGLERENLALSVFSGNVVLENLQLKKEALADLQLPITIKEGLLPLPLPSSRSLLLTPSLPPQALSARSNSRSHGAPWEANPPSRVSRRSISSPPPSDPQTSVPLSLSLFRRVRWTRP